MSSERQLNMLTATLRGSQVAIECLINDCCAIKQFVSSLNCNSTVVLLAVLLTSLKVSLCFLKPFLKNITRLINIILIYSHMGKFSLEKYALDCKIYVVSLEILLFII